MANLEHINQQLAEDKDDVMYESLWHLTSTESDIVDASATTTIVGGSSSPSMPVIEWYDEPLDASQVSRWRYVDGRSIMPFLLCVAATMTGLYCRRRRKRHSTTARDSTLTARTPERRKRSLRECSAETTVIVSKSTVKRRRQCLEVAPLDDANVGVGGDDEPPELTGEHAMVTFGNVRVESVSTSQQQQQLFTRSEQQLLQNPLLSDKQQQIRSHARDLLECVQVTAQVLADEGGLLADAAVDHRTLLSFAMETHKAQLQEAREWRGYMFESSQRKLDRQQSREQHRESLQMAKHDAQWRQRILQRRNSVEGSLFRATGMSLCLLAAWQLYGIARTPAKICYSTYTAVTSWMAENAAQDAAVSWMLYYSTAALHRALLPGLEYAWCAIQLIAWPAILLGASALTNWCGALPLVANVGQMAVVVIAMAHVLQNSAFWQAVVPLHIAAAAASWLILRYQTMQTIARLEVINAYPEARTVNKILRRYDVAEMGFLALFGLIACASASFV